MIIFNERELLTAMRKYADAKEDIKIWINVVKDATWARFSDVKAQYGSRFDEPSINGMRVGIFIIKGNSYRLVTTIDYAKQFVTVLFFLTHADYSKDFWKDRIGL